MNSIIARALIEDGIFSSSILSGRNAEFFREEAEERASEQFDREVKQDGFLLLTEREDFAAAMEVVARQHELGQRDDADVGRRINAVYAAAHKEYVAAKWRGIAEAMERGA